MKWLEGILYPPEDEEPSTEEIFEVYEKVASEFKKMPRNKQKEILDNLRDQINK